jgi:hypothetical protein
MQAPADPQEILRDRDAEIAKIRARAEWTEEAKTAASPQSMSGRSENMPRRVRQSESASSSV